MLTLSRRSFVGIVTAGMAGIGRTAIAQAERKPIRTETYTYKQVGDLAIKCKLIRPDDGVTRPVAVWIHGGGLINGHRDGISRPVEELLLQGGYALVSIDYRLAPETQLPAIIEDVEDAIKWIRAEGPERFNIHAGKLAIMGGSAGGYLTLTAGFRVQPPPSVLVSFWGYGDIVGEWYSKPSPHPRHHQIKMTREEAFRQVSGPPISDSRDRKGDGGAFYQYCRQHGLWPKAVSGWDPHAEPEKFYPYMAVKNVTSQYPPTLLIHGDADTDVPYEQSVMMANEFKKHGVEHELVTIPGAEHGLAGGDTQRVNAAYAKCLEFINRHMGRSARAAN
jgi:acetyl esterase/lipase